MTGITLWKQWHPALVHYPIAFLTAEVLFILLYLRSKKSDYELFSFWLLTLSTISLLPVVLTGLNDSGLDMGPGIPILLGLKDRIANAFRFGSTISVHVALVLPVVIITITRWIWRWRCRLASLSGGQGKFMLVLTFAALLLMYVASYVGGSVSHS